MPMMRASEAAAAIGARLQGRDIAFDSVSTDTRTLPPGALFIALKGERFDGHEFLSRAFTAGAAAAVVQTESERGAGVRGDFPLILAADTRIALGKLAAHWRRRFTLPLIALTGSSGKTTVKEMLACILREQVRLESPQAEPAPAVLATRGNLNNDIGVPLTLLELDPGHRYAVIEMGMNHVGEIGYLARLAAPNVGLVNNAGRAHLAYLGSEEAIARAKGELFEALDPEATAVINADDRYAALWRQLARGRRQIDFGTSGDAAVNATYALRDFETEVWIHTPRGAAEFRLHVPGMHNVSNALAAAAAATALDIAPSTIAAGLARFTGIKGRLQRTRGLNGTTLIDDTYNANPDSMRAAIAVLARSGGTRMLVLGDMGELGPEAARFHAEIGEAARLAGVDRLYALGDLARHAAQAFGAQAHHYSRIEELLADLRAAVGANATVLVKGSRFMRMERVVKALAVENPAGRQGCC